MPNIIPPTLAIAESTIDAYLNADYRVLGKSQFSFKIAKFCPSLQELLLDYPATNAAFITAFNPYGQQCTIAQNYQADIRLRTMLQEHQLNYFEGFGQDPEGHWQDEKSYLIMNLALEPSKDLARQFQQNAFVWIDIEAIPQLVLLR